MVAIEPGTIRVERKDDTALVRLLGEHDLSTSDWLGETLNQHLNARDGLVVSVAEADFIDSSVIKELFDADARLQEQGRRLVLHVGSAPTVERVLELSGLSVAMPSFTSVEEAVERAKTNRGKT